MTAALLLQVLSGGFFAASTGSFRQIALRLPALQVNFIVLAIACVLLALYGTKQRQETYALVAQHGRRLLIAGFVNFAAVLTWFISITGAALAPATAGFYVKIVSTVVLSALVLKDPVWPYRISGAIVVLLGVITTLSLVSINMSYHIYAAILSGLLASCTVVTIKPLYERFPPQVVLLALLLAALPWGALSIIPVWTAIEPEQFAPLFTTSVLMLCAQVFAMAAYALARASLVATFEAVRLPVAALYGALLLGEPVATPFIIGTLLIVLGLSIACKQGA